MFYNQYVQNKEKEIIVKLLGLSNLKLYSSSRLNGESKIFEFRGPFQISLYRDTSYDVVDSICLLQDVFNEHNKGGECKMIEDARSRIRAYSSSLSVSKQNFTLFCSESLHSDRQFSFR